MATNPLPDVKITSREFKANPYPFYARLRAEAPVHSVRVPMLHHGWLVTRYDDVVAVLKDDQHFVKDYKRAMNPDQLKKIPWMPPVFRPFMHHLLDSDGEEHVRLRGLIHKAFSPRMIEAMQARIETLANDLLDAAEQRGKFDLIRDYALPIPLTIIAQILGIGPKDQGKFQRWSKAVVELTSAHNPLVMLPPIISVSRFLRQQIKDRRANPKDDLITALVQAEEAGDRLNEDEMIGMIFILLLAGHETTVNLIGSGMLALMEHPEQLRMLRQNPALIKSAVEELLRYASPVEQATERYALEEVTIQGVTIPKGELVLAVIASANRDERQFENADDLDITRQNNKHVAFGLGVHYCVGAPLARMEGSIAINTLVQRLPGLHLGVQPDRLKWRPGFTVRGLEALPVAV